MLPADLQQQITVSSETTIDHVILPAEFFARHALTVARQLLGKYVVLRRDDDGTEEAFQIHETEAYIGAHDGACHGRFGVTPRTAVLFGPPGHWYVHFTYGMHWMLNVVTDRDGAASGVLIRGAGIYRGPGRLTKRSESTSDSTPCRSLRPADCGSRIGATKSAAAMCAAPRASASITPAIGSTSRTASCCVKRSPTDRWPVAVSRMSGR